MSQEELIVFYNVENLFELPGMPRTGELGENEPFRTNRWNEKRLEVKLQNLAKALTGINGNGPMMIGLAEVSSQELAIRLSRSGELAKMNYGLVQFASADVRGINCSFLYDISKVELLASEKVPIIISDEPEFHTRDILYAKVRLLNDEILHVFVNHWSSRRDGKSMSAYRREATAAILFKRLETLWKKDPDSKILIMGDLNDEPKDPSIQFLMEESKKNDTPLVNLMANETDVKGSVVRNRQWLKFDQMIVSNNMIKDSKLKVKDNQASVHDDPSLLYTYPNGDTKPNATFTGSSYHGGFSDHLPIYIKVEL